MPPAIELIKSGQIKALAVISDKRVASLPDVPSGARVVVLPADVVYPRRHRDDPRVGAPCFQDNSIQLRLLESGIDACSRSTQE